MGGVRAIPHVHSDYERDGVTGPPIRFGRRAAGTDREPQTGNGPASGIVRQGTRVELPGSGKNQEGHAAALGRDGGSAEEAFRTPLDNGAVQRQPTATPTAQRVT